MRIKSLATPVLMAFCISHCGMPQGPDLQPKNAATIKKTPQEDALEMIRELRHLLQESEIFSSYGDYPEIDVLKDTLRKEEARLLQQPYGKLDGYVTGKILQMAWATSKWVNKQITRPELAALTALLRSQNHPHYLAALFVEAIEKEKWPAAKLFYMLDKMSKVPKSNGEVFQYSSLLETDNIEISTYSNQVEKDKVMVLIDPVSPSMMRWQAFEQKEYVEFMEQVRMHFIAKTFAKRLLP